MEFVIRKEERLEEAKVLLAGYIVEITPKRYVVTVTRIPDTGFPHEVSFIYNDCKEAVETLLEEMKYYKKLYTGKDE